jgi:iron complex transport system ATP-binding protein
VNPLLDIRDAVHGYNGFRLGPCTLSLGLGEVVCLVGPNGAGKSTLLRLAAGIERPRSGEVLVEGRTAHERTRGELARTIGYLPQHVLAPRGVSVREVVSMGRFPHLGRTGFLSGRDEEIVDSCLDECGVASLAGREMTTLSGGERQLVHLAACMAQQPRAMLLDEPVTGLDLHHQVRFTRLLCGLAGRGLGIMLVTHDLNLAAGLASRVAIMEGGRILRDGSVAEVLEPGVLRELYGPDVEVFDHPGGRGAVILARRDGGGRC